MVHLDPIRRVGLQQTIVLVVPSSQVFSSISSVTQDTGTTIEQGSSQPLTEEQLAQKTAAYKAKIDEVAMMKEQSIKSENPEGIGGDCEKFLGAADDAKPDAQRSNVDVSGARNMAESRELKDISQMSRQEMLEELRSYGVTVPDDIPNKKLKAQLLDARDERARFDIASDEVDYHIGTCVQGRDNNYCTILAQLDTMSDVEISQMVQVRTGEDGKKTYIVVFPCDQESENKFVEITEDELVSGIIQAKDRDGNVHTMSNFPRGDADVKLITMAFVKRFGMDISNEGAWAFDTGNKFITPDNLPLRDNQHLEDITDYSTLPRNTILGVLSPEELKLKGFQVNSLADNDLSWISDDVYRTKASISEGIVTILSDGRKACVCKHGIFLSDGTKIENFHAMGFRRYDAQAKEIIISGNEFNNSSELRVPQELMVFFETGSQDGTPGVDKTRQPEF